ncbi:hypothetical protein B0J12DRAFT_335563 [Macrophomina phaseolina]|uniref:Uncharacterized protein n=1 Tax=Macrophomina phaseolina TaxID=35725 RepID=A0ABQ8GPD9_9PEZI|nr:hypothetical protein B0J12DRAFT_335563 [Macrophomina phaseolina]
MSRWSSHPDVDVTNAIDHSIQSIASARGLTTRNSSANTMHCYRTAQAHTPHTAVRRAANPFLSKSRSLQGQPLVREMTIRPPPPVVLETSRKYLPKTSLPSSEPNTRYALGQEPPVYYCNLLTDIDIQTMQLEGGVDPARLKWVAMRNSRSDDNAAIDSAERGWVRARLALANYMHRAEKLRRQQQQVGKTPPSATAHTQEKREEDLLSRRRG